MLFLYEKGGNKMINSRWERLKVVFEGIIIGILSGLVVSGFRKIIELISSQFIFIANLARHNIMWILFLVFMNLSIAGICYYLVHVDNNIKGSGIPQVEGQLRGQIDYNWWSVLSKKFIGGCLSISSGLFLGREGPSIQLGSAVGQGIAEITNKNTNIRKLMISGGAAAGLAAAFNAPIASTLFVVEEIYHRFSVFTVLICLSASISADFVSTAIFGKIPVLHMKYASVIPLHDYLYLIILGIILGIFGRLYEHGTLHINNYYQRLKWVSPWVFKIIPFLLVIPVEMYWPDVVGGGSNIVLASAKLIPAIITLLIIFALRFIMSILSYATGLPGGIFLPMLTLGALLGAIFASILIYLQILPTVYFINFIIISMCGFFACVSQSPFTAILLITEMVGSLQNLMALSFVTLISYEIADLLGNRPIYEEMLKNLLKSHDGN
jgi:H+/Cl- antiporter ClcA